MTRRFQLLISSVCVLSLGIVAGCSSSDAPEVPRGPLDFAIGSVSSVRTGQSVSNDGRTLAVSCTGEEPLVVGLSPDVSSDNYLGDFLLAVPGACGSTVSCGWVRLSCVEQESETTLVQVLTAKTPIVLDLPESYQGGKVTFHAQLVDSTGSDVLTDSGDVLSADLDVTVARTCL